MPRKNSFKVPREWVVSGEWPSGSFDPETPDAVAHAVAVATALESALEGRNKSAVAAAAEIERSTLYDILAGKSWADMLTLAKLEAHLDATLWPREPAPKLKRQR